MCVEISKKALEQGKCVVIGLQSTGESQTNEALENNEGELETFVSTPKQLLVSLIQKYFPTDIDDFDGKDPLKSMFRGIDSEERKWKRMHSQFDVDEMEKEAKRSKLFDDDNSKDEEIKGKLEEITVKAEESSEDNESEEESEEDEDEETEEEADTGSEQDGYAAIDNSQNDLYAKLLNELSDSDDDDIENSDTGGSPKNADSEEEDERALKLFCTDYSIMDPYPCAKRQRYVSEATFEKPILVKNNDVKPSTVKKIKRKPKESKPKEEKISDYARKITEQLKSVDQECSNFESYDSGFINELFTMDLSKICPSEVSSTLLAIKEELLDRAEKIGENLPINTLDALIDQLGGSDCVAEMTGRRARVIRDADGVTSYKRRNDGENVNLDMINIQEKDYFMNGKKFVAIISEAASSGISLHADRRALNKRKRVHITMELPWSADKAVQQFGRTHRSNQEHPPEYLFLISELAGEKRFVSTASKRLQSLGALTRGDRRAVAESDDLSRFSIENKYGKQALQLLYKTFCRPEDSECRPTNELKDAKFFYEARVQMIRTGVLREVNGVLTVDRENGLINKFLNRLLLMPVDIQNSIFDYFMSIFAFLVRKAKREGTYDTGTLDLGSTSDNISRAETRIFCGRLSRTSFEFLLHKIHIDRGMTWKDIQATAALHSNGIFTESIPSSKIAQKSVCFVYETTSAAETPYIIIVRPNISKTQKPGTLETFLSNHQRVTDMSECKKLWDFQYEKTASQCLHKFSNGNCKNGNKCEIGQRIRSYYVCSGSVLTAWQAIEKTFERFKRNHIQIVRIQTNENQKLVGLLVNPGTVDCLIEELVKLYDAKLIRTI
uniref:Strawberry notch helicase C domain-containing protein n=1 Tax=Panagrolaimus sp. PS1159 TaxID=55785 RepID=A0AC35GBX0_9BILA